MKKTFKTVVLALAVLCSGGVMTSCDSDAIAEVLNTIIGNLVNTGQTYTYQGSATTQTLRNTSTTSTASWSYLNSTSANDGTIAISSMQVSLESSGATATLTIPTYTDGKATLNKIQIYNLVMTANSDGSATTLSISDDSTIDGSITVNGKAYSASNLYIDRATATSGAIDLKICIYFDSTDNPGKYIFATNLEYAGTAVTE